MRDGDALQAAHRGNGQTPLRPLLPDLQKAAQSVLFVCGQFHGRAPAVSSVVTGSLIWFRAALSVCQTSVAHLTRTGNSDTPANTRNLPSADSPELSFGAVPVTMS